MTPLLSHYTTFCPPPPALKYNMGIIHFFGIFHQKPSSYWAIRLSPSLEPPIYQPWGINHEKSSGTSSGMAFPGKITMGRHDQTSASSHFIVISGLPSGKHTKSMEHHNFWWVNQLFQWPFSIAVWCFLYVCQRVVDVEKIDRGTGVWCWDLIKRGLWLHPAGDGRFARFHGKSGLSTNLGVWKQNLCGLLAMLSIVVEIRSQLMAVRILEF